LIKAIIPFLSKGLPLFSFQKNVHEIWLNQLDSIIYFPYESSKWRDRRLFSFEMLFPIVSNSLFPILQILKQSFQVHQKIRYYISHYIDKSFHKSRWKISFYPRCKLRSTNLVIFTKTNPSYEAKSIWNSSKSYLLSLGCAMLFPLFKKKQSQITTTPIFFCFLSRIQQLFKQYFYRVE